MKVITPANIQHRANEKKNSILTFTMPEILLSIRYRRFQETEKNAESKQVFQHFMELLNQSRTIYPIFLFSLHMLSY
jgi:hypothetical protein